MARIESTARTPRQVWAEVIAELPDLCTVMDAAGSVVFVSPSAGSHLGREPHELVGRTACDLVPVDDRRNCAAWLRSTLTGAEPPELVHGLVRASGEIATYETRLRRMTRADTQLAVAVSRDVTARVEFDRQLAEMSTLWNHVCDAVREGVLVLTATGLVAAANRVAARLLGGACGAGETGGTGGVAGRAVAELLTTVVGGRDPAPVDIATLLAHRDDDLIVAAAHNAEVLTARATLLREDGADESRDHVIVVIEPLAVEAGNDAGICVNTSLVHARPLLSRREVEVLTMLINGSDVRGISRDLGISVHTTRAYVKSVLKKLDARSQLQAAVVALRSGLIDLS